MRESDLNENRKGEMPATAIIRRMRSPRRIQVESADAIFFDVAAFKLDRSLGIAEHTAVERNLRIVSKWPDILFFEIAETGLVNADLSDGLVR